MILKDNEYKVIGTRPIRHDGLEKVTGRAVYGADVQLPNMSHGAILRSPHAHAKIISIDTSEAEKMSGVFAVITGNDFETGIDKDIEIALISAESKKDTEGHTLNLEKMIRDFEVKERELELKTEDIPYELRDHALFTAFAPYKDPRYAISIVIEHGGSGSSTAAPIAKKLFKLLIDRHEIREKIKQKEFQTI